MKGFALVTGLCLVILALYLDSRVPDAVVTHRPRVVVFTALVMPIRFLEDVLEQYFGLAFYHWYRYIPILPGYSNMDNGKVKAYDDEINGVPVRVYKPYGHSKASSGIIYYHGGGFCVLSADLYHVPMMDLATRTNSVVISVDYRLAPEHPYPAGLNDCLDVTRYIGANPSKYGIAPDKIFIAGDSAGGNIAASINGEKLNFRIKGVVVIYPMTQLVSLNLPSHTTMSFGLIETHEVARFITSYFNVSAARYHAAVIQGQHVCEDQMSSQIFNTYIGADYNTEGCDSELAGKMRAVFSKRASPLFNADLSELSPTLILLAEADVLRDEGLLYYKALQKGGVKVQKKVYDSAMHGCFSALGPFVQPSKYNAMLDDIAQYISNGKLTL